MLWSVHTSQHYKYSSFFTFNFPTYFLSTQQWPLIDCSWEALFSVSSTWYLFAQFAMRFTSTTFCVVHGRHYSVLLELCSLRHAMLNLNLLRWYLNFCWEEDLYSCMLNTLVDILAVWSCIQGNSFAIESVDLNYHGALTLMVVRFSRLHWVMLGYTTYVRWSYVPMIFVSFSSD